MSDDLAYPFPVPPSPGAVLPVAPGVHWLRMPLPFALDHVNLWAIEDGDGWTIVDAGLGDRRTEALWRGLLDGPLAGRPVRRLIVTHFHPDHLGAAGWLQAATGAPLWMPRQEWLTGSLLATADDSVGRHQAAFFAAHGLPPAAAATMAEGGNRYRTKVGAVPPRYHRVAAGDVLDIGGSRWEAIVGEGHSPELLCLHCAERGVLIAGDQILPRITPNVSAQWHEPEADPLGAFLASLDRFRHLPAETLVLPSHDRPFTGLPARLGDLGRHHAGRLAAVAEACAGGATGHDMLKVLFRRPLDDHQIVFALGEAIAHLVHLERRGALAGAAENGVRIFRPV